MIERQGLSFFFFKQKTAYEILRSDWSSDVCSSDLLTVCASRGETHPTRFKRRARWHTQSGKASEVSRPLRTISVAVILLHPARRRDAVRRSDLQDRGKARERALHGGPRRISDGIRGLVWGSRGPRRSSHPIDVRSCQRRQLRSSPSKSCPHTSNRVPPKYRGSIREGWEARTDGRRRARGLLRRDRAPCQPNGCFCPRQSPRRLRPRESLRMDGCLPAPPRPPARLFVSEGEDRSLWMTRRRCVGPRHVLLSKISDERIYGCAAGAKADAITWPGLERQLRSTPVPRSPTISRRRVQFRTLGRMNLAAEGAVRRGTCVISPPLLH